MTIKEKQADLVEQFSFFDDWAEKYQYIIDLGKELSPYPEEHKVSDYKVKGCQSQVWLYPKEEEDKLVFMADSDAMIVKGLVAMLTQVFSGHTPREIITADLHFINKMGLSTHLSPTRSNGLLSMLKKIKAYALAFETKQQAESRLS